MKFNARNARIGVPNAYFDCYPVSNENFFQGWRSMPPGVHIISRAPMLTGRHRSALKKKPTYRDQFKWTSGRTMRGGWVTHRTRPGVYWNSKKIQKPWRAPFGLWLSMYQTELDPGAY